MRQSGRDWIETAKRLQRALKYHGLQVLRRRISSTDRLLHVMIVFVVPLLLAGLTWLSNAVSVLPFVIYPPLAAGTYTLFADPESQYADPRRFVGGMTLGAASGWAALSFLTAVWYTVPPGQMEVHAGATALAVGLTALLTWTLDLEVPTSFSAALLALLAGPSFHYVIAIGLSSGAVAIVYSVWREHIYDRRADFLYRTARRDDRVLIPVRGVPAEEDTALFGAWLAAAHEAGTVVIYRATPDQQMPPPDVDPASKAGENGIVTVEAEGETTATPELATLDRVRRTIEETVDVPTELAIETGDPDDPATAVAAAAALDCDLIVTGQAEPLPEPTPFLTGIFASPIDAVAFQPTEATTSWSRVLVLVRGPGPTARAMVDFATRIAATPDRVSVAHTVEGKEGRRAAETMLTELVDSFESDIETRVATGSVEDFLAQNARYYDVVFIGSSSDRSVASRILSPPTFQHLEEVAVDLALVHVGDGNR